jgi:hypothetical protein
MVHSGQELLLPILLSCLTAIVYIEVFKPGKATASGMETRNGPQGPNITVNLRDRFCGTNNLQLSRVPLSQQPKGWSALLGVIHGEAHRALPVGTSVLVGSKQYIPISRATFMSLFAITNARPIYSYASASGYRSSYPSYCGIWNISWPIGGPCIVTLDPHDSHTEADVYPPTFKVEVDKCIEMMAGIISLGGGKKVAFPGRAKGPGPWVLKEKKLGFPGAHGARHLYNMMGGKVYDVDLLELRPATSVSKEEKEKEGMVEFEIPSVGKDALPAKLFIPLKERELLANALDNLPWNHLSWSSHRGMKDILLAFGRSLCIEKDRGLASTILKTVVKSHKQKLVDQGWDASFVEIQMADIAVSSFLAGSGNSGDMVRVVVAVAEAACGALNPYAHETTYWKNILASDDITHMHTPTEGDDPRDETNMLVGLTKYFILEWSTELDYQLYHDVPMQLLLG